MTRHPAKEQQAEPFSLRRWARRKLDASRPKEPPASPAPPSAPGSATAAAAPLRAAEPALPAIESLTIDSDFTLFMQPNVDAAVRRAALKQLFRDPRFNLMDGLDVYIDDYTKADPIPDEMVKQLAHAQAIFNPPATMVTPEGHVVDVPPATVAGQALAAPATTPAVAAQSVELPATTPSVAAQSVEPPAPAVVARADPSGEGSSASSALDKRAPEDGDEDPTGHA
jgi:hypothetical protein